MKAPVKYFLSCLLSLGLGGTSLSAAPEHYLCDEPRSVKDLESQRWYPYEFPIKVYIPQVAYPLPRPEMYVPLVQEAFTSWTARLPALRFSFVDAAESADIRIDWRLDFRGDHVWGRANLPILYHDSQHRPRHRSTLYLAVMAQIGSGMSSTEPIPFSYDELLAIAKHEVGHSLGLRHSLLPGDLMCSGCWGLTADYKRDISDRDVRTLLELYRLPRKIKQNPCQPG